MTDTRSRPPVGSPGCSVAGYVGACALRLSLLPVEQEDERSFLSLPVEQEDERSFLSFPVEQEDERSFLSLPVEQVDALSLLSLPLEQAGGRQCRLPDVRMVCTEQPHSS